MPTILFNRLYIYAAIAVVVVGLFAYQQFTIQSQKTVIAKLGVEIQEKQSMVFKLDFEKSQCKAMIDSQNRAIEGIQVDYNKKADELMVLKNKPEKERFKIIYENTPTIGAKSNECEDIKKILDDIRNVGY